MLHVCRRITLATLAVLIFASSLRAELLPSDPALVTGQLDNGLKYIVRKHSNPVGKAVMWIHFDTGSLNETDRQRGIAHFLEHMAFNGSTNFAPGALVPFFQSLGMQFGRDQNAFTSFDQTVYQLSLPDVKPETLDKGMTFFSDVVSGLTLSPGEIDNERGIIQEERRRRLSGRQRVGEIVLERSTPGSLFGKRSPIGTEETIQTMTPADFQDYYGKWYGPGNSTVMVVADAEPDVIIAQIKDKFGALPAKAVAPSQEIGVKPYDRSFAIVATDPEIKSEEVQITRIDLPKPPVTTEAQYRDDLVGTIGQMAWNERLSDKVAAGDTSYSSARVSAGTDAGVIYNVDLSARAKPGKWKEALAEAAMELQRGRAFGFSQRDIDDVKKQLISSAEWAVQTDATASAQALISRVNSNVADGEPTLSPRQRLELLQKLVPTITREEVSKRFADEFNFTTAAFVAILPSSSSTPSESDLLELGVKALAVTPTQEAEVARATELMSQLPKAGAVAEGAAHEASKVWSGWLSNNVRVHYRFMDDEKDQASIAVSLIGAELLENADNRGITTAAQLAWGRAATKSLTSTDIRELMNGKKVVVRSGGGGGPGGGRRGGGGGGVRDSINLTVAGSPQDFEIGMQLAYLLLTEPKIEQASFLQFQSMTKQFLQEALINPMMAGARAAAQLPYPDDEPRAKPLTAENIDKLTLDAAQAWLEKLIAESPIEVTIVGDLPQERALELAAKYLGALPSRPRVSKDTFADARKLIRPKGPRLVEKVIETPTKQAFVASSFYGADETNRDESRALSMAARILTMRMTTQVREEAQLVYSISASSRPASTFSGFGVFGAAAPTEPGKADALAAKLASMYEAFAKDGPTDEELAIAQKQIANQFKEQLKEPGYWAGALNQFTFRNGDLDAVVAGPEAYQKMTAKAVHDTFAKYYSKENSIVVVIKPGTGTSDASK